MLNNSQGVIGLLLGLKSRITSTKPLLTMLALLMVCLFGVNESAWGTDVTFSTTNFSQGSGPYKITKDSVDFYLNVPNWRDGSNHFYVHTGNSSATITWDPVSGYTIAVSGVSLNGQNTQEKHWLKQRVGSSYIRSHTSSDNTEVNISQSTSTDTKTYTTTNTDLFPNSKALGNGAYFKLRAEKGYDDADHDYSYEYQINWATISYSVTPPAPTLKNGSSLTRYQYVEGRDNNTVVLTNYFQPFSSGVSMNYEVWKKNGGSYAKITSGFDITNNIFKTTVVGEYQIFAKSGATGAFVVSGRSEPIVVTIEEVQPLTIEVGSQELYVDGTTTMTVTEKLNTAKPVVFDYDHDFFEYNECTGALTIKNGGNESFETIKKSIHVTQEAAGIYEAVDMYVEFTVKKYTNMLYANTDAAYHPTMRMGKDLAVTLTATNTDYTGSPIQLVKQTAGDNTVAVFDYTQGTHSGTVRSKYKKDVTATWSIHQDENYKYLEANNTFSVDVKLAAENTCYVLNESSGSDTEMDDATWTYNAPGAVLSYKIKRLTSATFGDVTVYGYDANNNRTTLNTHSSTSLPTSYGDPIEVSVNENIRKIEFYTGTYKNTKYVSDVKVTRATYLNASDLTINKTSSDNPVYPSDGVGVGTLPISYSLANGGNLKISNDNPKFTISPSEINVSDCNGGSANISISYASTVAGTDVAHLVIYNDVYRKEVTITGITSKRNQTITWNVGNAIQVLSEIENAASVSANTEITYSTNNSAVIAIENGKLVAKGVGEATITVNAPGDDEYNAVEGSKTITVTSDLVQHIVWNQSLLGLHTDDADKTLNAYATSDVDGCTTNGGRAITYSSSDESVVKIVNGIKLRVIGKGTAYVTASQAGGLDDDGHTYMAVIEERKAIVRDPSDPCEAYVYQQTGTATMDLGWNWLSQQDRDTEIALSAEPDQMTFRYKFEKKSDLVGVKYGGGTMYVEQKIGNNDWTKVGDDLTPSEGSYQTATVNLDRHATKVRIRAHGVGYHSFTDCQISMLRYIETSELATFEAKVGQEAAQNMTLSYSNITGPVTLILGHTPSNFSVSQTAIEGSCGDHNSVNITVTYTPIAATEEETELLRISDGVTTHDISLTGVATVTNRYISWDIPSPNSVYTVETVNLSAQALTSVGNSPAGSVFYTKGELSTTGNLSGSTLTFSNDGVAYIAAQGVADPKYNATDIVTKTFNVSKTPTSISVAPTVETIVSGTAAEDVMLTGGVAINTVNSGTVKGTFEVISPTTLNAGTYALTVRFTPEDKNMYTGCTATLENVTIAQRTPEESELGVNVGTIIYGQRIDEASMTNSGTLAGTWYWKDEDANKEVKAVGTYDNLNVYFVPENTNYATVYSTVSVTVNKATPVVTAQASAITYGQPISASELSTASGEVSGTWAWSVDKTQVLSVGNHVLKANFTSANANYSDLSNVDVTLTVNKIEKLEVPVALSFCAGGEVTFHDNTYTEAGEYQIEAEGPTRDTIYNVTVTKLQPTTGTDSKTITVGASESWNGINLSGYAVGSHEVVFHTTNAAGCDSTVTLTLTVVPLSNIFTNAEGDGDWGNANNWESGIVPTSDPDIIVTGALEIKESITVGSLTIEQTGSVSVISGGTLTVKGVSETRAEYGDVHVLNDGAIHLSNSADLQVRDFTLDAKLGDGATSAASGQVSGDSTKLHVNSVAYFQLSFDPSGAIDYGWYDFTVPFPVNISGGIERVNSSADKVMVCGQDFLLMEDDEASFVNGGKGWRQISSGVLMPGKLYTITFDETVNQNTFRFAWNGQGELTNGDSFTAQYLTGSDASRNGWNAIGNAMLRHGYVAGDYKIQAYNHTDNVYEIIYDPKTFAVGTAFFIQVEEAGNIDWKAAEATPGRPIYAPQRVARNIDEFRISLRDEATDAVNDVLFFSASEEATEAYVIGHDLLKKGIPTEAKKAQMWATKRGKNLCDVEGHMMNNKASSDLNFFVPKAGSYELAIDAAPEDATLYLTYNGRAIWNLSMSAYEFDLEQGTTEGYGLRIVASQQTTTDIENGGLLNDENGVRKVLIDDVIYIVTPEGKMYDIVGKGIKF